MNRKYEYEHELGHRARGMLSPEPTVCHLLSSLRELHAPLPSSMELSYGTLIVQDRSAYKAEIANVSLTLRSAVACLIMEISHYIVLRIQLL